MFRLLVSLALIAVLLWSCGPDSRTCSGPNFRVVLKLMSGPLPADTVVRVTYAGSAVENFRLSDRHVVPKVAFCQIADESGVPLDASAQETIAEAGAAGAAGATGAAGAAGESGDPVEVVQAIYCQLWTGGFAQLKVTGTGFETANYDLVPKAGVCTVDEPTFVLDAPDGGS